MKFNIKNIKIKIFQYKNFIFSAYLAAALSFFLSIIRDYVLIKYTNFSQQFFEMIYFSSWFSLIVINLIMINLKPNLSYTILACLISSFTILLLGNFVFLFEINFLILSMLVFNFWICGNIFSRALIKNNKIFLAKSRDTITSLFIIFLSLLGLKFYSVTIISLFSVTLLFLIFSRQYYKDFVENKISISSFINFFLRVLLTNFSGLIILIWAFYTNRSDEVIFGIDAYIVVRFSLYAYQFLIIGADIMIIFSAEVFKKKIKFIKLCYISLLIISILICIFFNSISSFTLPLLIGVARYFEILIANQDSLYR